MKKSDRRLCRWYGHVTYVHTSTAYEPEQITVRCSRCTKTLAGPFLPWDGRMIPAAEQIIRSLYKPSPLLRELLNKASSG